VCLADVFTLLTSFLRRARNLEDRCAGFADVIGAGDFSRPKTTYLWRDVVVGEPFREITMD
jgi:hypothetical protein